MAAGQVMDKMSIFIKTRDPNDSDVKVFVERLSHVDEPHRMIEIREKIFHEVFGEDGHGYCLAYGSGVPRSEVYQKNAGPSEYPLSINTMTSRTRAAAKPKAKTKGLHPESSSRVVRNAMKHRVVQTDSEDEGVPVENPNVIGDDMLNRGVVLNEMNKFIDSRTDDTPTPFGPLITDILSNPEALSKADNGDSGPYQIATNEKDHGRFPKMNETQWKKSLGRIRESRANCGLPNPPLPDEVAWAEEEPQDVHRSPPLHAPPPVSVPPPPHWSMSYEEYRNMQASHEHLCRRINASELTSARNHYDLVSMFRVFTSQEPLPLFAPPFQEPFLPPNAKEWFRLGHGRSRSARVQQFVNYISDLETRGTASIVPEFPSKLDWLNTAPLKLNKGLEATIKDLLPFVEQRHRVRHLHNNESRNHLIARVVTDLDGNFIIQIGSTGEEGFCDGSFEDATFNRPQGLAYDVKKNLLYRVDTENHALRHSGRLGLSDLLNSPWDVCFDSVNKIVYIAMAGQHQIWEHKMLDGVTIAFSGNGYERNLHCSTY
ncbi:hypothetical protein RHGRI_029822 [Rhododendron griersonianum]|uniref:Uncharacterized protein n=1 Tax=Rhododendron griersonianum TaxID=479676 RepID=A0AAV6IMX9_9ERIC|nr:hypothetical protein RHGRI_029822 [Rhododendron griersonianum]